MGFSCSATDCTREGVDTGGYTRRSRTWYHRPDRPVGARQDDTRCRESTLNTIDACIEEPVPQRHSSGSSTKTPESRPDSAVREPVHRPLQRPGHTSGLGPSLRVSSRAGRREHNRTFPESFSPSCPGIKRRLEGTPPRRVPPPAAPTDADSSRHISEDASRGSSAPDYDWSW